MAAERLFVYGSLKRGARHHAELGGARFLGEAQTEPGYALVPVGEYWALVESSQAGRVTGDVFEVNQTLLAHLDDFEGEDYRRAAVRVISAQTGENFAALAYLKRTR